MDGSSSPHYRRSFAPLAGPGTFSDTSLPPYSRRPISVSHMQPSVTREQVEHAYHLTTSKNKAWVTLKVLSSAKSPKQLPTFHEGEAVDGTLALNLEKPDAIQSVCISVTGRIITGAGAAETFTFFDQSLQLWCKSNSRTPSPSSDDGKLNGEYSWPFKIVIPKSVTLPGSSGNQEVFRLPQTFSERQTRAAVYYEITATISRGKLRADSHLCTGMAYVPSTKPGPPSALRQLAYAQNSPLLGPEIDPDGWKVLEPVTLRGTAFNLRPVTVKCTLSLARPLCYTRGSVIPCFLEIESQDQQILDLLSAHSAPVVRLQRRVRYCTVAKSSSRSDKWKEDIDELDYASWWPSGTLSAEPCTRRLMHGEIQLERDLKPSSTIAHFSLNYAVVLLPFKAPGFAPHDTQSLTSTPVEIATAYARGPRPKHFCPPCYEKPSRKSFDYSTTCHKFTNQGLGRF